MKYRPDVYVLIRLFNPQPEEASKFIESLVPMLNSLVDSVNNYGRQGGRTFVIINDDTANDGEHYANHRAEVDKTITQCFGKKGEGWFDTDSPGGEGSAMATYRIRNFFLNETPYPSDDDIAVTLDQDDRLTPQALQQIAQAMKGNDIAISKFNIHDTQNLDITDDGGRKHNKQVSEINSDVPHKPLTPEQTIALGTMGWTKSYTRRTLSTFMDDMTASLGGKDKATEFFRATPAYEDFIDLYPLLINDIKIGGTIFPTHIYVKHPDSITSQPSVEAFRDQRTAMLLALVDLCYSAEDSGSENHQYAKLRPDTYKVLQRFVINKSAQIESIINDRYRAEYAATANPLYSDFFRRTYPGFFLDALCDAATGNSHFEDMLDYSNVTLPDVPALEYAYSSTRERLGSLVQKTKGKKTSDDELDALIGKSKTPSQKRARDTFWIFAVAAFLLLLMMVNALFFTIPGFGENLRNLPGDSFVYAALVAVISLLLTEWLKLRQNANNEISFRKLYYSEFLDLVRHLEANLKVMIQIRKEMMQAREEGKTVNVQNIHFENLKFPPESSLFSDDIINVIEKDRVDDFSRLKLNIRNINNSSDWLKKAAADGTLTLEQLEWEMTRNFGYYVNFRYMVEHQFSFPTANQLDPFIDSIAHNIHALFLDYTPAERVREARHFVDRYRSDRRTRRAVLTDIASATPSK